MPVFLTTSSAENNTYNQYFNDAVLESAKSMGEARSIALTKIQNSCSSNHGWLNHTTSAVEISKEKLLKLTEEAN